jgi:pilus assembly protein FimV
LRFVNEHKINMTTYNKLKIAILSIIASQNLYAINVDPAVIQSTVGELLYAEINFRQANRNAQLEVGLAKSDDLDSIRATHQPPTNLNFFTRYNADGSGVITITSSRPINTPDLNFVIKIKDGSTTRLQHIQTSLKRSSNTSNLATANEKTLTPIMIVNEKDIALNLPVSSTFSAPPPMGASVVITPAAEIIKEDIQTPTHEQSAPQIAKTAVVQKNIAKVTTPIAPLVSQNNHVQDPLVKKFAETQQNPTELEKPQAEQVKVKTKTASPNPEPVETTKPSTEPQAYIVKNNESLWTIANRIANQEYRSVSDVMQQIKNSNEHAFIQGDVNRLKRGATLNLDKSSMQKEDKKVSVNTNTSINTKQLNKTKYRLHQAEMSLVTDSKQNSANGSSLKTKNSQKTSKELSSKVMISREKTVKLQRNVTQLEVALNQKDHRIQLLNARLAQLQQQLQNQQTAQKSHN